MSEGKENQRIRTIYSSNGCCQSVWIKCNYTHTSRVLQVIKTFESANRNPFGCSNFGFFFFSQHKGLNKVNNDAACSPFSFMMKNLVLAFVLLEALVRSAKFLVSITCSPAPASYLEVVFFATELLPFESAYPNRRTMQGKLSKRWCNALDGLNKLANVKKKTFISQQRYP